VKWFLVFVVGQWSTADGAYTDIGRDKVQTYTETAVKIEVPSLEVCRQVRDANANMHGKLKCIQEDE
jgi:hypothetical protein